MYGEKTVGVVVPAYNEEEHVGEVLRTIPLYVDRVYAVDDASTDGTWDEIVRMSRPTDERPRRAAAVEDGGVISRTRIVPIRHEENRGVGGAIKTGYLSALEDDLDVVAVMAGDGQMDPTDLERIIQPIVDEEADYVKGNRLLPSKSRRNIPRFRLFGNLILSFLTKVSSGYWTIDDPQNGYTAISGRALEQIDVERLYEFYGYCNDLLVKLNAEDMVVVDAPTPAIYDEETSHIDYTSYVPLVSSMLVRNFLWRLKKKYVVRDFHPLVLLYVLGLVGSGITIVQFVRGVRGRGPTTHTLPRTATNMMLTGLVFVLAMIYDKELNEELDEQFPGQMSTNESLDHISAAPESRND